MRRSPGGGTRERPPPVRDHRHEQGQQAPPAPDRGRPSRLNRQGLERAVKERAELEVHGLAATDVTCSSGSQPTSRMWRSSTFGCPNDRLKILGSTKVILLTGYEDSASAYRALAAGAAGYVSKSSDNMGAATRSRPPAARRGDRPEFAAGIASEIQLRETDESRLPAEREGEVLRLLAEGRTAQERRRAAPVRGDDQGHLQNLDLEAEALRPRGRGRHRNALGPARVSIGNHNHGSHPARASPAIRTPSRRCR